MSSVVNIKVQEYVTTHTQAESTCDQTRRRTRVESSRETVRAPGSRGHHTSLTWGVCHPDTHSQDAPFRKGQTLQEALSVYLNTFHPTSPSSSGFLFPHQGTEPGLCPITDPQLVRPLVSHPPDGLPPGSLTPRCII